MVKLWVSRPYINSLIGWKGPANCLQWKGASKESQIFVHIMIMSKEHYRPCTSDVFWVRCTLSRSNLAQYSRTHADDPAPCRFVRLASLPVTSSTTSRMHWNSWKRWWQPARVALIFPIRHEPFQPTPPFFLSHRKSWTILCIISVQQIYTACCKAWRLDEPDSLNFVLHLAWVVLFCWQAREIESLCEELRRVMMPFAQTLEWMTGDKFPKFVATYVHYCYFDYGWERDSCMTCSEYATGIFWEAVLWRG